MTRIASLLLALLLVAPTWAQSSRAQKVQKTIERLVQQSAVGNVAVSVIHLPSKERVDVNGERPMALASVFKVPVMLELARQMQTGQSALTLQTRIPIRHADKCIGSGSLQHQPDGTAVSVERLVELMETRSDNTATDVLFRRIGLESVDKFMRSHGLLSSQIFLTNRAAWLISLARSSDFRRMSPHQIAARWNQLSAAQRLAAAQRTEKENSGLTLREFQRIEDQSSRDNTHEENVVVATAVDNKASSRDLAVLLEKLHRGQLLNERWTDYCLGVLGRQSFNTRIPRHLPKHVTVYHKTGTIAGVVNDIGIIEANPENAIVVVVLVEGVPDGSESSAEALIGKVAQAAYAAYK
jgi:beta-lactamase class A